MLKSGRIYPLFGRMDGEAGRIDGGCKIDGLDEICHDFISTWKPLLNVL